MKYTIKIPEPCGEKWETMTPTEKGRYCDVCKKEIFDFTRITNLELIRKLDNNENVCARYKASQLNVDLYSRKNSRIKMAGMLVSLSTAMALSSPAYAQQDSTQTNTEQTIQAPGNSEEKANYTKPDTLIVHGRIESQQEPVPFVTVLQKGSKNSTVSDEAGKFELFIQTKTADEKIILVFQMVGMETKEVVLDRRKTDLEIELESSAVLLGEVVIVKEKKPGIFRRIGNLFRKGE